MPCHIQLYGHSTFCLFVLTVNGYLDCWYLLAVTINAHVNLSILCLCRQMFSFRVPKTTLRLSDFRGAAGVDKTVIVMVVVYYSERMQIKSAMGKGAHSARQQA